jgi:hypothetical protein
MARLQHNLRPSKSANWPRRPWFCPDYSFVGCGFLVGGSFPVGSDRFFSRSAGCVCFVCHTLLIN